MQVLHAVRALVWVRGVPAIQRESIPGPSPFLNLGPGRVRPGRQFQLPGGPAGPDHPVRHRHPVHRIRGGGHWPQVHRVRHFSPNFPLCFDPVSSGFSLLRAPWWIACLGDATRHMIGSVPLGPLELIPSGLISLFRSYSNTIPVVHRPYYLVTHASQVLPCIVLICCTASRRTALIGTWTAGRIKWRPTPRRSAPRGCIVLIVLAVLAVLHCIEWISCLHCIDCVAGRPHPDAVRGLLPRPWRRNLGRLIDRWCALRRHPVTTVGTWS